MNKNQKDIIMQLYANEVHIWSIDLTQSPEQIDEDATLLNTNELEKALRFRFDIHRERYMVARATLRKILSAYLAIAPSAIQINLDENDKPFVPDTTLQFNLSHSNNMAVYAIVNGHHVGIDIEFIKTTYSPDVARRYFNSEEINYIENATLTERATRFYQIWARKEALIKATGKGLSLPLQDFSTILNQHPQIIPLDAEQWRLYPLDIHPDYASAFATNMQADTIRYWQFVEDKPQRIK